MLFYAMSKRKRISFLLVFGFLLIIFVEAAFLDFRSVSFFIKDKECIFQPDGYKKWDCLGSYFEKLVYKTSTAEAMAEAIKLKEERVVADCHLFGHVIGETALEKQNFDAGEAFSSCVHGCSDGCFHGVMERYVRNEADPYSVVSKMQDMCDSIGTDWLRKRQCYHGVGHGLLAHGYLSFPEALEACGVFGPEWAPQCRGGAVMENMDQYLLLDINEDDFRGVIPKICGQIQSTKSGFIGDCLDSVALGFLYYTGYDLRRSEDLCEEFPNPSHVEICKGSIMSNVFRERPSGLKGF